MKEKKEEMKHENTRTTSHKQEQGSKKINTKVKKTREHRKQKLKRV